MQFLRAGCIIYQTEKILLQPGEQERNEERILNDKTAGKYDLATVSPVSTKEYEHICVYSTDVWSTHRTVPPEVSSPVEFPPEVSYDSASESVGVLGTADSSEYYSQPSTSGSCESIASGCSNKENSIPLYIPSNTSNKTGGGGLKTSRPSPPSYKDVAIVSAAGISGGVTNGSNSSSSSSSLETTTFTSSGKHAGRRKKRNLQLKDHLLGSSSSTSTNGTFVKTSEDEVANNVATQNLEGSGKLLKSKATLESDGSSTTHLQPLVSDLRTEE